MATLSDPRPSSLQFGTSGLRGLVVDLVGEPARRWTAAFLAHIEGSGRTERLLLIGRDLRPSSPAIARDCAVAAQAAGWSVLDCGALPTPALALAALERRAAAVMVTGSHIPDDRNGLKFYAPGEITKADEAPIRDAYAAQSADAVDDGREALATGASADPAALDRYRSRYLESFAADALSGLTVGIYQQSSVARDFLADLVESLGARAVILGRADGFVPVDTEAHRPEDVALLRDWGREGRYSALISTDGDADRPLVADARGEILRGDVLGLLVAQVLALDTIVTPVTSSAAVETSGVARRVLRTRVGSPFVIAGMEQVLREGAAGVLGFEANGGCLLGSDVALPQGTLPALPTRDAVLPIVCALIAARRAGNDLQKAAAALGAGHAVADRLKDVPATASGPFLTRLAEDDGFARRFFAEAGQIASSDRLDGLRVLLDDGSVVHFRASGNAPELRCYAEAGDPSRAAELLHWGLSAAARELGVADRS